VYAEPVDPEEVFGISIFCFVNGSLGFEAVFGAGV
jgi:hypothetical protein